MADENIDCPEDESEENSVRSVPGGEEPDNEQWYAVELNNGVLILKDEKYYNIDYSVMPELITRLKPGDIIYEPNGAFIGDLVGHIAMVYDIVYYAPKNQYYVITIESYTGGVQYGLMTPTRFESKDVQIYRLTDASEAQVQGAVAWAQSQYGASWFFKAWKKTEPGPIPVWYCAELIWAAYYHQGIYLDQDDNNNWGSVVFPYEMAAYENAIPILHDGGDDYQAELAADDDTYHTYSYNGKTYTEAHDYVAIDSCYEKCRICEYIRLTKPHEYTYSYTIESYTQHRTYCECGEYELQMHQHNYEYIAIDNEDHNYYCICGHYLTTAHTYEPYNCCYEKCSDCGYKNQIAEHDYTYSYHEKDAEQHYSHCQCGDIIAEDHISQIVIEGQIKLDVCTLCGYDQGHEHYYTYTSNKDGETHQKVCDCGYTQYQQCFGMTMPGQLSRCATCGQRLNGGLITPLGEEDVVLTSNKEDEIDEETE